MADRLESNAVPPAEETCFLLLLKSEEGERYARLVIESLRSFGGRLGRCPVWVFLPDPDRLPDALSGLDGVCPIPLVLEEKLRRYPLADKVCACAQAEAMAGPAIRSLVWLSLDCLIVNPPLLFDLGPASGVAPADAAFRPVHHRNIGSRAAEPLDGFWREVYSALEIDDMPHTVESFADGQTLRPYFNTHCFAFNPAAGLCRAWWAYFKGLVSDRAFQAGPCHDELHQIFLHQAILSTLVAKLVAWERVRLLPPEYNYPLNLLDEIPPDRRVPALNDLVNAVYELSFPWTEIEIREPLRSWLARHMPGGIEERG